MEWPLDTGLERTSPLAKDIEWFEKTYGLTAPVADGPGVEYGNFLKELAKTSPPEFICHFYNVYFAHSAGGRMIGRKVRSITTLVPVRPRRRG
jgi:heme oxygenase